MKYRIGCLVVLIFIVLLFVRQNNYEGFEDDPCDKILKDLKNARKELQDARSSDDTTALDDTVDASEEYKTILKNADKNKCKIPKQKSKKGIF